MLEGELSVRLGRDHRVLRPGDELDIPRRTPHQMWNAGAAPARVRWETRPAGRTEAWWAALDAAGAAGGRPSVLRLAPLLREYGDVFRLAAPAWVLAPALALLSLPSRLRR